MVICSSCNKNIEKYFIIKRKLCKKCYNVEKYKKREKEKCFSCGNIRPVNRRADDKPYCSSCYARLFRHKEKCSKCSSLRLAMRRLEDGSPLCSKCSEKYRIMKICINCGHLKLTEHNTPDGPLCKKCYKTPYENCSICGRYMEVHYRRDNKPFCANCYRKLMRRENKSLILCKICNELRPKFRKNLFGEICSECYKKPLKKCHVCGKEKKTNKYEVDGPICKGCYTQPKVQCSRCPNIKGVAKRDENNQPVCVNCYIKERMETDECYRITILIRKRIQAAFKQFSTTGKKYSSRQYGINYQAIIDFLGPCPGNREDYHIDHIIPICSFDLDDPEQIKLAFAPENHQWLTVKENLSKGYKLNWSKNANL